VAQYKTYGRIHINGNNAYVNGVTACLDVIESTGDGRRLLQALSSTRHTVTISHTDTGNECAAQSDSCAPLMTLGIANKDDAKFKNELNVVIGQAKKGSITLEHIARQLAVGLTPATYVGASNVVPPTMKKPAPQGASPQDQMMSVALQTAAAMQILQDLMAGTRSVSNLPADWDYELPRVLRQYLTPGSGGDSKVGFNCTATFHCAHDPAMHLRPPAIGLAHELIHALHNSQGKNMVLIAKNNENIEELITTGIPPYNYEDFSDNKMRTQWPRQLELRKNY
jgi:hypothetical protein